MTDGDSAKYRELLEENEVILARFRRKGVELGESVAFDFRISLESLDSCREARKILRSKKDLPKQGLIIVVDDSSDYHLAFAIKMVPSAKKITELESKLISVGNEFCNAEVTWEFKAN